MAARKHRGKEEPKQAANDFGRRYIVERDLWSQIRARAGEVATLAEVYPTLASDYGRGRQMGHIIAIIGEKCQQLVELIDTAWKTKDRPMLGK